MIYDLLHNVTRYTGLFAFCASSGILVPLPEDISLLYAGMRIQSGEFGWGPALVVAMAGVMLRDILAYWFGRLLGEWVLTTKWVRRIVGGRKIDRARAMVDDHGSKAVLFGRFFVGFRAPVFLVAGAMGVSFRKFLLWNSLGMLFAVPGVVALGYAFGAPVVETAFWIVRRGRTVIGVALALAAIAALWWFRKGVPAAEPCESEREDDARRAL